MLWAGIGLTALTTVGGSYPRAAAAALPEGAFVRVICRGIHRFTREQTEVECRETSLLPALDGTVVPGTTAARADLVSRRVTARAAGGSVRDLGYNGGQSESLLKSAARVETRGGAPAPLWVVLKLRYAFAGFGEGRLRARLWAAPRPGDPARETLASIVMTHAGLRGAALTETETRGEHRVPPPGPYPASGELELRLRLAMGGGPDLLSYRAEVKAYSLPNLDGLSDRAYAAVEAHGQVSFESPCPLLVDASPVPLPGQGSRSFPDCATP